MLSFTPQQRKDITRRQLNIATENAAYNTTQASLTSEKAKLLSVDSANQVFYDFHSIRVGAYEDEARAMNGTQPAEYTDGVIDPYVAGDLSTSAKTPGASGALFFPSTPPVYVFFVPKIVDAVNGYNNPIGTDARYELNILSNAVVYDGLTEMIFRLNNGITAGTPASTSTSTSIPSGVITSQAITVSSTTGFAATQLIYINNASASGIYRIISVGVGTLTIASVVHSQTGISSPATVDNTVAAFNATERQNLTSGSYQEILTNISNRINALITEWELKIDTQITQLGVNNEDRSPYTTQNATALVDVTNTKLVIDTWQALPNTGVTGKYTSANISPISAEIIARQTFIPGRIPQIVTALGSVAQVGDSISGVVGSPYYERYKWLNIRINKASGSARRFYAADDGINFLGMLSANNTAIQIEYDAYFLTKAILFVDDTTIVHAKDVAGLTVGDTITILSETQAEIQRAVMELLGTTQIRLDKPIPNSYLVGDQVRLFKLL